MLLWVLIIHYLFAELSSILWTYLELLIHSAVDGYLGCFQSLTIITKAVVNIHVQAFLWT